MESAFSNTSSPKFSPLTLPMLREDIDSSVIGGCTQARDCDFQTRKGSILARPDDETLYPAPQLYPVIEDIAQEIDGRTETETIAILTRSSLGGNITGFGVRGVKKLNGSLVPESPNCNGWTFPADAQPAITTSEGMIEHSGRDIRIHCDTPLIFGLPPSINEPVHDFVFANVNNSGNSTREAFLIDGPFGEVNVVRPPHEQEIRIECDPTESIGQGELLGNGSSPMWGNPTQANMDLYPRYRYMYLGASILRDGFQESNLFVSKDVVDMVTGSGHSSKLRAIVRVHFDSVRVDIDLYRHNDSRGTFPKRARKLRLYCAPSNTLVADPRSELEFRLVNEIDVTNGDKDSQLLGYRGVAEWHHNPSRDGQTLTGKWIAFGTDASYVDAAADSAFHTVRDLSGRDGDGDLSPESWVRTARFAVDGDEENTEFFVIDAYATRINLSRRPRGGSGPRTLYLRVPDEQVGDLERLFGMAAPHPLAGLKGIKLYNAFEFVPDASQYIGHLAHKSYVGDELMSRPTYSELSGLPQTLTSSLSPPRRGGTNKTTVPVIWNTTDKDGMRRPYRIQRAHVNPEALVCPDIYPETTANNETSINDFPSAVIGVTRSRGGDVMFFKNEVVIGSLGGSSADLDFSDVRRNVRCTSRKSIAETPEGIYFLTPEGVRILDGLTISKPISSPVRRTLARLRRDNRLSAAVGAYSPVWRQYILHFPAYSGRRQTPEDILVFDAEEQIWQTASLTRGSFLCAATGTDGYILLGTYGDRGGSVPGVHRFQGSESYVHSASYKFADVFGDPATSKHIFYVKAYFTSDAGQKFSLHIACENQTAIPGQDATRTRNFSASLTSGERTSTALHDRAFSFEISGFVDFARLFLVVEKGERS